MVLEQLFDTQLFLLKSIGLVLSYRKDWRGVLMKLFALFGFLTVLMGAAFSMHVIFVTSKSIEDIAQWEIGWTKVQDVILPKYVFNPITQKFM
jgi:predicted membrane protein